jgi:hypothetical protein
MAVRQMKNGRRRLRESKGAVLARAMGPATLAARAEALQQGMAGGSRGSIAGGLRLGGSGISKDGVTDHPIGLGK